jgi:hypothetical protein
MTRNKIVLAAAVLFTGFVGASQASLTAPADQMFEREASEGPRGEKLFETHDRIAREASEGPRGGDNERPGDRQGRGRG